MPRGGARQGKPGGAYPNRADLRSVKPVAATGQGYGEAGQQLAAQQAMPIAPQPVPAAPAGPAPGGLGPLSRPTERPDEPMSQGAPWGPGANDMGLPTAPDDTANADLDRWVQSLPLLEQLASSRTATQGTRVLYRKVLAHKLARDL